MRKFFTFVLIWGLLGCGDSSSYSRSISPPPSAPPGEKFEQIEEAAKILNLPPANEPERNEFTIQMESSDKDRLALIPFHYTTDNRTKMTIDEPLLTGENCSRQPDVAKLNFGFGKSGNSIPMFKWSTGWVNGKDANVLSGYGIEEDTSPNRQETVVIGLVIPSGCTQVSGAFDVKLR